MARQRRGITEFLSDGTWVFQSAPSKPVPSFIGKWSRVAGGRLKVEVPPSFGSINEYAISNGSLTIKDLQGKVTRYTRVQAGALPPAAPPEPKQTIKERTWERPGTKEAAAVDRADAELNRVYKQLMGVLDPQKQKSLREEERAWIKWRDAEAKRIARSTSAGGSAYRVDHLNAMRDLIEKRTTELKALAEAANLDVTKVKIDQKTQDSVIQSTDLSQLLVGKWQGARHLQQYLANGTFFLDAEPGDSVPLGHWRIEGNKLLESLSEGRTYVYIIISINQTDLVIQSADGRQYTLKRVD